MFNDGLHGPVREFFEVWFSFHPVLGLRQLMDLYADVYNFFYGLVGLNNLFVGF